MIIGCLQNFMSKEKVGSEDIVNYNEGCSAKCIIALTI